MGKQGSIWFFLYVLFFLGTMKTCLSSGNLTSGCFTAERRALLKFKDALNGSFHRLSSWHGNNCCSWNSVHCDETTGRVIKLDLKSNFNYGSSGDLSGQYVRGLVIDSSLLDLQYLEYLDLSGNDFQGSSIPKFFGSMKQLRYLNLSGAGFSGPVPHQLGNLSSLQVLDLSQGSMLIANNLEWVSRLTSLQTLDMSQVNLSHLSNFMKSLTVPLLELRMSGCGLDNTHLSYASLNSTLSNIEHLDLSANSFEGKFPDFLQHNFTSLKVLDLSMNNFNSSVPLFVGESYQSLVQLSLASNRFSHIEGGLSTILWNGCHLKLLDLSMNILEGEILGPKSGNFSAGCAAYDLEMLYLTSNQFSGNLREIFQGELKHLRHLDLRQNLFRGTIPASVGKLLALEVLDLSDNQLTGPIPVSLGRLNALRMLRLTQNQLNGSIPISLGQLSKLLVLDISSNALEGLVSEAHFANLSMLKELRMDSNAFLTFKMQPGWNPPFKLQFMRLGSCKLGPQFSPWLRTQQTLYLLDLSNASISGPLPSWFRHLNVSVLYLSNNNIIGPVSNLPLSVELVDLSYNLVSGPLPRNYVRPALKYMILKDNLLNGSIPDTLCKVSTELQVLDLTRNMLDGNVPECWMDSKNLNVLKLSSNRLTGVIPSSFGQMSSLQWLQLNNNSFQGDLPLDLKNCRSLVVLDVGENRISGNIPKWIGENLKGLAVLRLHKNNLNGRIPSELCQLQSLQILDIAGNSLTGSIPRCLSNFTGMVLNRMVWQDGMTYLRNGDSGPVDRQRMVQVMKGVELEYTTTLAFVVNMDISSNKLVGEVPQELTSLSGLIGLNLSHNHLRGGIPEKIGSMESLISLDLSSNNLSGVIPGSMAALTSLSSLNLSYNNLSYNNLSGRIPSGNQLQTLIDPSIYAGNSLLCGAPLTKKCSGDESSRVPTRGNRDGEDEEDDDGSEKLWFYLGMLSGFGTGLWGVVGVLVLNKRWRRAFFQFVEVTVHRMSIAKLKRG